MQVNRSQIPSAGSGKSPQEVALEAQGLGAVSYTVVPVTATSPVQLGRWMLERDLLRPLLFGEHAHVSLMQRSKELLKLLSRHGLLDDSFIHSLFQVELEVLQDLVPVVSHGCLGSMIAHVAKLPVAGVTASICRLLAMIVKRCRDVLMWAPTIEVGEAAGDMGCSDVNDLLHLHVEGLALLWTFAEENSRVENSVSHLCMDLITEVLDRGCTPTQATIGTAIVAREVVSDTDVLVDTRDDDTEPQISWTNHWRRCFPIVCRAVRSMESQQDLVLATSVLRHFIVSFLDNSVGFMAACPIAVDTNETQLPPYRPAVVSYLEVRFGALRLATGAIGALKAKFMAHSGSPLPRDPDVMPADMQKKLNDLKLGVALHNYYSTLEKMISFICFLQRASFSTLLSSVASESGSTHLLLQFSAVKDIWNDLFLDAVTVKVHIHAFSYY